MRGGIRLPGGDRFREKGGLTCPRWKKARCASRWRRGSSPACLWWRERKVHGGAALEAAYQKAAGGTFPEFNNQAFTNESSLEAIGDASQALPFFAERKCVSVSDFDVESKSADELNKLYELWELCPETTVLVFWYPTLDFDGKRSSKWKKFLKQAEERGTVVLCGRRSRTELLRFLGREAEKSGCVLPRPSGERLLDYAGEDLTALKSEMDKLCAYALATGAGAAAGDHPGDGGGHGAQVHRDHGVPAGQRPGGGGL